MGQLTTHVLDTAQGKPGDGIAVELYALHPEEGRARRFAFDPKALDIEGSGDAAGFLVADAGTLWREQPARGERRPLLTTRDLLPAAPAGTA